MSFIELNVFDYKFLFFKNLITFVITPIPVNLTKLEEYDNDYYSNSIYLSNYKFPTSKVQL